MIPTEVITMLGSSVLGGVMKLMRNSQKANQENMKMAIERMAAVSGAADKAAERDKFAGGPIVRRIIVCCTMIVFLFPTIHPLFQYWIGSEIPVHIAYYEEGRQILGLFGSLSDKMKYIKLDGIVVLPEFRHIIAAILGFYFGSSSAK